MANLALQPSSLTLPPELECYIFEIAAEEDRATIVQLVLIAHRVQIWRVLRSFICSSFHLFRVYRLGLNLCFTN